jgi:hypothetical protein
MTSVFNAPYALRAEELQRAFDGVLWSAYEDRLGGAPMACSPALQTGNEVIVKIAHMQISGHLCLDEISDLNSSGRSQRRLWSVLAGA